MPAQREPLDAAPWVRQLAENIEAVRLGEQAEAVHQLRIAASRLDVWLRFGGRRMLRDDLRWLRRAAAGVRNFDVLLERPWPAPVADWLASERAAARERLLAMLAAPRCAALLGALAGLGPVDRRSAHAFIRRERRKLARRGRVLEAGDAASTESIHRLRRVARRVRYALEWSGRKSRALKALQDDLGRLNDTAVAIAEFERSPCAAEFADWRADLARELQLAFDDARAAWRETDIEADEEAEV
jgi:CHAD domain-containing protein